MYLLFVCCLFLLNRTRNFFINSKQIQLTFFDKSVQSYYCHFFIAEWFAGQTKIKTIIQEMENEELNECLTMFYAAVRREDCTEANIDRYSRQPPNNKPWLIVVDSAFQTSNKVLNTICKQMMQEGKVGPTIHKNSTTSEQLQRLQQLFGEWATLDPSYSSALYGFT